MRYEPYLLISSSSAIPFKNKIRQNRSPTAPVDTQSIYMILRKVQLVSRFVFIEISSESDQFCFQSESSSDFNFREK